jgi:hypothetical protein
LPAGIDGRSPQARRWRDLVRAYEQEFEATTDFDRGLIARLFVVLTFSYRM